MSFFICVTIYYIHLSIRDKNNAKKGDLAPAVLALSEQLRGTIVAPWENREAYAFDDGTVDIRRHDPKTGIRHVLPVDYNPSAKMRL
jgi:hypothetical protein